MFLNLVPVRLMEIKGLKEIRWGVKKMFEIPWLLLGIVVYVLFSLIDLRLMYYWQEICLCCFFCLCLLIYFCTFLNSKKRLPNSIMFSFWENFNFISSVLDTFKKFQYWFAVCMFPLMLYVLLLNLVVFLFIFCIKLFKTVDLEIM